MRETVALGFVLLGIALAVSHFLLGCAAMKPAEAEATYLGQQLRCVDRGETRSDIDECRAKVRERWGKAPKDDGGAP